MVRRPAKWLKFSFTKRNLRNCGKTHLAQHLAQINIRFLVIFGHPHSSFQNPRNFGGRILQVDVMRTRGNHPAFGVEMRESLGGNDAIATSFLPVPKMVDFRIRESTPQILLIQV